MNLTSRSKEGRKWEEQFKKLSQRHFDLMQIIYNAKENLSIEQCPECENLKKMDKPCPECGEI